MSRRAAWRLQVRDRTGQDAGRTLGASGNGGYRQIPDAEYSPRVLRENFSGTGGQSEPPHGMVASSP